MNSTLLLFFEMFLLLFLLAVVLYGIFQLIALGLLTFEVLLSNC